MTGRFSCRDLNRLHEARPPVDAFGPGSRYPFLIIDAGAITAEAQTDLVPASLGRWLCTLPCPVIGFIPGRDTFMGKPEVNDSPTAHPLRDCPPAARPPDCLPADCLPADCPGASLSHICDTIVTSERTLARITRNITRAPFAAMILIQHLRCIEAQPLKDAVMAESFAYGTVQTGPDYQKWLKTRQTSDAEPHYGGSPQSPATTSVMTTPATTPVTAPVTMTVTDSAISITLNRPRKRNAIDIEMRDALCEALDLAQALPDLKRVSLNATGRCFSTGGAAEEFGSAPDGTTAHLIRSLRLPAHRLAALRDEVPVHVHVDGAAIGAGAEIAAFGTNVSISPKAWFQLPELKYGLIPGAGGTASLTARIGRHRTACMALSMARINAQTALAWGLADELLG